MNETTEIRRLLRLTAGAALVTLLTTGAAAQTVESYVVTIDATTPQPVATGFTPSVDTGEVILFAEGNIQAFPSSSRFDDGWFGPTGYTRMQRTGQPIVNGMPYGALTGGFSSTIANYRYIGRMGAFHLDPSQVGQELRVALNMSDADLASISGQVKLTAIYVPDGTSDIAQVTITDGTALPAATGLVAAAGDHFVILPYGTIQTDAQVGPTEGYFDPEGLTKFNRAGQPYPEGPYGGLYGYFDDPLSDFYIGDGGTHGGSARRRSERSFT